MFLIKLEHGHATCRHLFSPFLCQHAYVIKLLLFHSSFCWVFHNLSVKHYHEPRVFDACTLCCYRSVTERQVAWVGEKCHFTPFFSNFSAATLPTTNRCVEENNNVGPLIRRFMLPLGATVNMDGSALYRDFTAILVAQLKDIKLSPGTRYKFQLCPHHTRFLWRPGTKNHTV